LTEYSKTSKVRKLHEEIKIARYMKDKNGRSGIWCTATLKVAMIRILPKYRDD